MNVSMKVPASAQTGFTVFVFAQSADSKLMFWRILHVLLKSHASNFHRARQGASSAELEAEFWWSPENDKALGGGPTVKKCNRFQNNRKQPLSDSSALAPQWENKNNGTEDGADLMPSISNRLVPATNDGSDIGGMGE